MPNEIKTISPEEEKTPSHLPVLTVDKDDVHTKEKQPVFLDIFRMRGHN